MPGVQIPRHVESILCCLAVRVLLDNQMALPSRRGVALFLPTPRDSHGLERFYSLRAVAVQYRRCVSAFLGERCALMRKSGHIAY